MAMYPQHRLRQSSSFEHAQRRGRRWRNDLLTLAAVLNGADVTRIGFAVSRRVGNAVARNRVRRRLREVTRRTVPSLPAGWDLVIGATTAAAGSDFAALDTAWADLLARARLSATAQPPAAHR
jgi:ribonuclease P protein component